MTNDARELLPPDVPEPNGEHLALDGLLRELARGGEGADERFVARVMGALEGEARPEAGRAAPAVPQSLRKTPAPIARTGPSRPRLRTRSTAAPWGWWAAGLAASALIAAGVVLSRGPSGKEGRETARASAGAAVKPGSEAGKEEGGRAAAHAQAPAPSPETAAAHETSSPPRPAPAAPARAEPSVPDGAPTVSAQAPASATAKEPSSSAGDAPPAAAPASPAPAPTPSFAAESTPQSPGPAAPAPPETAPAPQATVAAAATLVSVAGSVHVREAGRPDALVAVVGQGLAPGQTLLTEGGGSAAVVAYADASRLELGADTEIGHADGGRKVVFAKGELAADIRRQPRDRPFALVAPHAEVRVLGTRFSLIARPEFTRVEMEEGSVRFTRRSDGRSMDVRAGFYAAAGRGLPWAARPINLLADAGFEGGGQGWKKDGAGRPQVVRTPARSGARALQIVAGPDEQVVAQEVPVIGGAAYEASGWVMARGAAARIRVLWLTAGGEIAGDPTAAGATDAAEWRRVSKRLEAPPSAVSTRFVLRVDPAAAGAAAPGTAWFDDLMLRERR